MNPSKSVRYFAVYATGDVQVLKRLVEVCKAENVVYTDQGLEALIFTAEGDMRNALNNLQSTHAGFSTVSDVNVFKVCDQPHPIIVKNIIESCMKADVRKAVQNLSSLWNAGYSAFDIIGTIFRVTKSYEMPEPLKLCFVREIGFAHIRIAEDWIRNCNFTDCVLDCVLNLLIFRQLEGGRAK